VIAVEVEPLHQRPQRRSSRLDLSKGARKMRYAGTVCAPADLDREELRNTSFIASELGGPCRGVMKPGEH